MKLSHRIIPFRIVIIGQWSIRLLYTYQHSTLNTISNVSNYDTCNCNPHCVGPNVKSRVIQSVLEIGIDWRNKNELMIATGIAWKCKWVDVFFIIINNNNDCCKKKKKNRNLIFEKVFGNMNKKYEYFYLNYVQPIARKLKRWHNANCAAQQYFRQKK